MDPDDSPFCPAEVGPEPHNYQPLIDVLAGKTVLYCQGCGEVIELYTFTGVTPPAPAPAGTPAGPSGLFPKP